MAAEFTINDTAFDTLEYEAEHEEVLTLTLEDMPAFDASRVKYSVVVASDGAPELTFSPSTGVPATPSGNVTVTMPASGCHSYIIQCQINEGRDSTGRTNREYTKRRGVSLRSTNLGLRKWCPGETTEFAAEGWTEEQNAAVDLLDTYGLGSYTVVTEVTAAAPIVSSGGTTPEISITPASGAAAGSMSSAHYTLLANAADASTPSTLALRTSGGAIRADWFEADGGGTVATTGSIRIPASGSIYGRYASADARIAEFFGSLIFGSTSAPTNISTDAHVMLLTGGSEEPFARFLSSGDCTTDFDIRMGLGRPRVFVSGTGDVPLITPRDAPMEAKYVKTEADGQSDTLSAFPISGPMPAAATIIAAWYIPVGTLTSDDSNYATLTVSAYSIAGALVGTVVQSTTRTSGSGGTGSWTDRTPVGLAITSAAVAADQHLEFSISKTGTGAIVPPGLLVVRYVLVE